MHDDLADFATAIRPDLADLNDEERANVKAARRAQFDALLAHAKVFASQEVVDASPYSSMPNAGLREIVTQAGWGDFHADERETDLRRLMTHIDALRVGNGQQPYAATDMPRMEVARPKATVAIPTLPMSPSGQWAVAADKSRVAIQGQGVHLMRKGTIVALDTHGEAMIRSLVEQGVKLEAYPPPERRTCATCGTSWGAEYPETCPLCYLMDPSRDEGKVAEPQILTAPPATEPAPLMDPRTAGLVAWVIAAGGPAPDADGLWGGQVSPPIAAIKAVVAESTESQAAIDADPEVPSQDPLASFSTEAKAGKAPKTGKTKGN